MMPAVNLPNVDVSLAARQYVSAGLVLVPIARGSKGPNHIGWNLRPQCVEDDGRATKLRGGIGLAHLFSRTACIDLDDLAKCRHWLFDEHLINLDALMNAPDAVQISSGRVNRGKLLYRLPEGVERLVSVKVKACGLELRCAAREADKTVQDVLPPTIHPDTLLPYQWAGAGDWHALPVLPPEILEIWQELEKQVDPVHEGAGVPDGDPEADPVVQHLEVKGLVKAKLIDGTRHIVCPFQSQHTDGKSKVGDCSYFPALTGGYAQGHFHCFHTACDGRSDEEFLDGIGYDRHATVAAQFDTVDASATASAPPLNALEPVIVVRDVAKEALRTLQRDRQGRPLAIAPNLEVALIPEISQKRIAKDSFRDTVMWAPPGTDDWRDFTDNDYTELRIRFERNFRFKPIGRELIRDLVHHTANKYRFDSAQLWLNSLQWDGIPRVEQFAPRYLGTVDTPYTRAVSCYLWTAMAGRVLEPGVKADMVPILTGPQGARKSTVVMDMVPAPEHYAEIDFFADETDLARKMRGTLIAEFAELKGLRSKEIEHVKAYITRQRENWTPKFIEFNQTYPRRCVFIGTTNQEEYLADETGNRRWLPLTVGTIDCEALRHDRDQLWAEGARLFEVDGVAWAAAERLAREVHGEHMVTDPWQAPIEKWLAEPETFGEEIRQLAGFRIGEILYGALAINTKEQNRGNEMRVAAILRKLGLVKKDKWMEGRSVKCWQLATSRYLSGAGSEAGTPS
jgi:predicted P-loop ATPase